MKNRKTRFGRYRFRVVFYFLLICLFIYVQQLRRPKQQSGGSKQATAANFTGYIGQNSGRAWRNEGVWIHEEQDAFLTFSDLQHDKSSQARVFYSSLSDKIASHRLVERSKANQEELGRIITAFDTDFLEAVDFPNIPDRNLHEEENKDDINTTSATATTTTAAVAAANTATSETDALPESWSILSGIRDVVGFFYGVFDFFYRVFIKADLDSTEFTDPFDLLWKPTDQFYLGDYVRLQQRVLFEPVPVPRSRGVAYRWFDRKYHTQSFGVIPHHHFFFKEPYICNSSNILTEDRVDNCVYFQRRFDINSTHHKLVLFEFRPTEPVELPSITTFRGEDGKVLLSFDWNQHYHYFLKENFHLSLAPPIVKLYNIEFDALVRASYFHHPREVRTRADRTYKVSVINEENSRKITTWYHFAVNSGNRSVISLGGGRFRLLDWDQESEVGQQIIELTPKIPELAINAYSGIFEAERIVEQIETPLLQTSRIEIAIKITSIRLI